MIIRNTVNNVGKQRLFTIGGTPSVYTMLYVKYVIIKSTPLEVRKIDTFLEHNLAISFKSVLSLYFDLISSLLGVHPADMPAQACRDILNEDISI